MANRDFTVSVESKDFSNCTVRVEPYGLTWALEKRTASFFSGNYLDGYVFSLLCNGCGQKFIKRGIYDASIPGLLCQTCGGKISTGGPVSPWWSSELGVEKIAGLARARGLRSPRGADSEEAVLAELEAYDPFTELENFLAPFMDVFETRLTAVELAERLDEVFTAWKTASRRRKPEYRQADFEKFIQEQTR